MTCIAASRNRTRDPGWGGAVGVAGTVGLFSINRDHTNWLVWESTLPSTDLARLTSAGEPV